MISSHRVVAEVISVGNYSTVYIFFLFTFYAYPEMVRGGQDNRKFRNIRRKKKLRKSFPVPIQGQSNVDFDEPTTSHEIIDEDIITEGEEVIIVPLEDEDTSILEAEKVIEPSVNKSYPRESMSN